ncbi:hypothetical protein FRB91_005268, partial [Serendipita sp. 411]
AAGLAGWRSWIPERCKAKQDTKDTKGDKNIFDDRQENKEADLEKRVIVVICSAPALLLRSIILQSNQPSAFNFNWLALTFRGGPAEFPNRQSL